MSPHTSSVPVGGDQAGRMQQATGRLRIIVGGAWRKACNGRLDEDGSGRKGDSRDDNIRLGEDTTQDTRKPRPNGYYRFFRLRIVCCRLRIGYYRLLSFVILQGSFAIG